MHLSSRFRLPALLLATAALLLGTARAADTMPAAKPTIFVLGDSTAHNTAIGTNGHRCVGWGTPLAEFFNPAKATVNNAAHAGQSSRTFYTIPHDWPRVQRLIKPGDFVLIVFGINDGNPPQRPHSRGSLPGLGNETVTVHHANGLVETVHTYGWYMTQMVNGARAKGAHVYLLTVTARDIWTNPKVKYRDATPIGPLPADYDPSQDRIERGTAHGRYTKWTEELGRRLFVPVLDLTDLCADKYEKMGRETVMKLYSDHNHTYAAGAELVAESVVSGLKAFPHSPFLPLLSAKGRAVPTAAAKYVSENRASGL